MKFGFANNPIFFWIQPQRDFTNIDDWANFELLKKWREKNYRVGHNVIKFKRVRRYTRFKKRKPRIRWSSMFLMLASLPLPLLYMYVYVYVCRALMTDAPGRTKSLFFITFSCFNSIRATSATEEATKSEFGGRTFGEFVTTTKTLWTSIK